MYIIAKTVILKCFCNVLTWCVPQAELNTLVFQLQTGCVVLKHSGDIRLKTDQKYKIQDLHNGQNMLFIFSSFKNVFTTSDGLTREH